MRKHHATHVPGTWHSAAEATSPAGEASAPESQRGPRHLLASRCSPAEEARELPGTSAVPHALGAPLAYTGAD